MVGEVSVLFYWHREVVQSIKCRGTNKTTLLEVTGDDYVLFYWHREVVQSIKCRGANNCVTCGFNEGFHFIRSCN